MQVTSCVRLKSVYLSVQERTQVFACSQIKPFSGSEMTIDINEFDENWQKVAGQKFTVHKSFFNPHDFAVSKNYYVFFQNAMSFKMVSLLPDNMATCM